MRGPASSTTAEIYLHAYEPTAIFTALHLLKRTHVENIFHHINNIHQNIKFTTEDQGNGELAFRSNQPEVFLGKDVLKICSKFTGKHPCRSVISIKLLWAWMFCKFAAYFQNTFS